MNPGDVAPEVGDLVLPTYYRIHMGGACMYGTIVGQDGIFYDILWATKATPEEYWTTDDFYVVKSEPEAR